MTSLGDSGLPVFQAGHCDWQRPHSVQVAKSSMPFQVKSSILPRPNVGVIGRVLEIDWLAVGLDRQQRAQPVGQPLEDHVDRREEDVQVLGVQHDDQEREHDADVQKQRHCLQNLVAGVAERLQDRAE